MPIETFVLILNSRWIFDTSMYYNPTCKAWTKLYVFQIALSTEKKWEMPYRNHQAHNKNVIGKKYIYKRLKKVLNKCKSISEKSRGLDLECSILNT